MMALTQNDPTYQPGFADVDTSVTAAIPMYGAYDLVEAFTGFRSKIGRKIAGWVGALVLGVTPDQDPGSYVDASPMAHIDGARAARHAVPRRARDRRQPGAGRAGAPVHDAPARGRRRRHLRRARRRPARVRCLPLDVAARVDDGHRVVAERGVPTTVPGTLSADRSDERSARSAADEPATTDPTTMARTAPS